MMPQLTSDEWPADGEPTTTEQETPLSDGERRAVAAWRAQADAARRARLGRGRWGRRAASDLFEHVVLHSRCTGPVDEYDVPLRDVIDSQHLLHDVEQMWNEGCPNDCRDAACQPLAYALLLTESAVAECERHPGDVIATLTAAGVDFAVRRATAPR